MSVTSVNTVALPLAIDWPTAGGSLSPLLGTTLLLIHRTKEYCLFVLIFVFVISPIQFLITYMSSMKKLEWIKTWGGGRKAQDGGGCVVVQTTILLCV